MKSRPRFSIFAQVFFAILAAAAVFGAIFGRIILRNQAAATDRAQQEFQKSAMRSFARIRESRNSFAVGDSHAQAHRSFCLRSSPGTPAPAQPIPPPSTVATLTEPTEVAIAYGKTTLPRGTKLKILSRDQSTVTVLYFEQRVSVPITSTDLK